MYIAIGIHVLTGYYWFSGKRRDPPHRTITNYCRFADQDLDVLLNKMNTHCHNVEWIDSEDKLQVEWLFVGLAKEISGLTKEWDIKTALGEKPDLVEC